MIETVIPTVIRISKLVDRDPWLLACVIVGKGNTSRYGSVMHVDIDLRRYSSRVRTARE